MGIEIGAPFQRGPLIHMGRIKIPRRVSAKKRGKLSGFVLRGALA